MVLAGVDPRLLTQLVAYDRMVFSVRDAMAAGQRRVKSLEELETEYKVDLAEAKQRHTDARLEIRKFELEIEDLRRQIKTHNHRLSDVSDTREYRALNDEVRYLTRQIGEKEEAQLALMESLEELDKAVAERTEQLEGKSGEVTDERARLDGDRVGQEEKLAAIEKDRGAFMDTLPTAVLRFYERRAARCDMPVVWLEGNACGHCHHKLTPQAALEVRYAKSLIECESCGRVIVAAVDETASAQDAQ